MKPMELLTGCVEALSRPRPPGLTMASPPGVTLVLPPRKRLGDSIRLTASGGPLGEVLTATPDRVVARFDAHALMRWLLREFPALRARLPKARRRAAWSEAAARPATPTEPSPT